jgi:D-inositol-3-phosphate glycosyltransferase
MILDQEKSLKNLGVEVIDLGCHISVPALFRKGVIGQGVLGWTSSTLSLYRDIGLNPYNLARSIYLTSFVFLLAKLKRESGFQLLHAHWAYPAGYIGHLLKKREGVKLVISVYGYDVEKQSERYRFTLPLVSEALRDADKVIAVDRSHYEAVCGILGSKERVLLLSIPIDTDRFRPSTSEEKEVAKQRLGLSTSDRVVLFGPRMESLYSPLDLVEAVSQVSNRWGRDLNVVFLGRGELEEKVRTEVSRLSISARFPGLVSHEYMREYYWASDVYCDICVHGQGVSALEAMSCGVPVIGYRGTQLKVRDKQDGILVEIGDKVSLARAIEAILADRGLATRLGSEGRKRVLDENDTDKGTRALAEVYSSLLET